MGIGVGVGGDGDLWRHNRGFFKTYVTCVGDGSAFRNADQQTCRAAPIGFRVFFFVVLAMVLAVVLVMLMVIGDDTF